MTNEEFGRWAEYHADLFGMANEQGASTIQAWRRVFEGAGYTAQELEDASNHLALHGPPKWVPEHLAGITRFVQDRRAVEYRKEVAAREHERGTCTLCGGAGRVVVPHVKAVSGGQWVPIKAARGGSSYYTMAVLCSCALGQWMWDRMGDPEKRPMTLATYQARNPYWREHMAARRREQTARAETGVEMLGKKARAAANEGYQRLVEVLYGAGNGDG